MPAPDTADIDALTHVARILHDQLKVYPLAASIAGEHKARSVIERTLSQRWGLLEQVEPAIRNHGGDPPSHSAPTGFYHQLAARMHGVADESAHTAIHEVAKGEDDLLETVRKYAEADDLSQATRTLMASLHGQLAPTYAEITGLKAMLGS